MKDKRHELVRREERIRSLMCPLNTVLSKDLQGAYFELESILGIKIHREPREVGSPNKFFMAFIF